ncbi:peptidase S8/S53 domain-containing protein [Bisporella sp. PMI_857]|nr:peptidase S8/S53 domain-containing protein [Bisporella sp. PMI_857]
MKFYGLSIVLCVATPLLAAPARTLRRETSIIPGQYIIQLRPGVSASSLATHLNRRDSNIQNVYQFGSFSAYTVSATESSIAEIEALPDVVSVESDTLIFIPPPPTDLTPRELQTATSAPWHLGDVSHKVAGSTEYVFDSSAGEGQRAYILDSGIRLSHEEFEGRAVFGYNAVIGSGVQNGSNTDIDGHGTHVAGIVAGKTHGVAKKATVVDVKVAQNDIAQTSWVLAGIDWVVNDVLQKGIQNSSVINLSLAAATSSLLLDNAVTAAFNLGILSVAAAGNNNGPAAELTPARVPVALTIGMTNITRGRTNIIRDIYGSNWGPELDFFAPGQDIVSASYISDTGLLKKTGTSMATPLVVGLVCYLRALNGGKLSPDKVKESLTQLALKDAVIDPKGSPNLLVYNGSGA